MNPIPGIRLRTGSFVGDRPLSEPPGVTSGPGAPVALTIDLDDWLHASVITRNAAHDSLYAGDDGLTVLLDGYVSAPTRPAKQSAAAWIAEQFMAQGEAMIPRLRGSYTCLIHDRRNRRAIAFNDRLGSRPLFYRRGADNALAVAAEVRDLLAADPGKEPLDHSAVVEFLICGNYFSDRTLFSAIRKLPQASKITLDPRSFKIEQYWQINHTGGGAVPDPVRAVDEMHTLLLQSVDRVLENCRDPFLFLSGGLDSRLILGLMLERGVRIPVVTYGSGAGDDYRVAVQLAKEHGLKLTERNITFSASAADMEALAVEADCRAEVIDSPSLNQLFNDLSSQYATFITGDVIDTAHPDSGIAPSPLDETELFSLDKVSRLESWLSPRLRGGVRSAIEASRAKIAERCGTRDFVDLFECVYYTSRLANLQNGFAAYKMRYFEQARPLLDEDVVDLFTSLPINLRADKMIFQEVLKRKYPALAAVDFARTGSLLGPDQIVNQLTGHHELASNIRSSLGVEFDPRLKELFNTTAFAESIDCILSNTSLPPLQSHWLMRLPGAWRFLPQPENRVHPVRLLLRLFQIQIYLNATMNLAKK